MSKWQVEILGMTAAGFLAGCVVTLAICARFFEDKVMRLFRSYGEDDDG